MGVVRPAIQKALEKQIKDSFGEFDRRLYSIKVEADKVQADMKANPDPENAKNVYSRYWSAAQREFTQKKTKAEEVVGDKHANVAVTKEDSMFKHIELPGGVSTKATKYTDMAREGERWESPVFSLGSANETANLPNPKGVTRKPHGTRRAQLRAARDSGTDFDQYGVSPVTSGYHTSSGGFWQGSRHDADATRTGPYEQLPQGTKPGEYIPQILGTEGRNTLGH